MTNDLPTLIISRQPRAADGDWNNARSWLGGKPQLGNQPWPRGGTEQTPFYFLAQIDLAEVAREVERHGSQTNLPDGALAFFVGRGEDECAVVHVSRSEPSEPTDPPTDMPAALNPGGDIFPAAFDDDSPRVFPRWPVNIAALDLEIHVAADADEETRNEALLSAQVAAVERRLTRRQYFFSAREVFQMLGEVSREFRWHSAQHYAVCLRRALAALPKRIEDRRRDVQLTRERMERLRPKGVLSALGLRSKSPNPELTKAEEELARRERVLAETERPAAEFEHFVRDVSEWVRGKDPWESMRPETVAVFTAMFEQGKKDFPDFTRFYTPRTLVDLETETLLALATADDRAYTTMPEAIRTLINARYLLPANSWHQMFGKGVDIQGNAAIENEGNVMLLQLVYDDMIHWRFGDIGAYQFWISPADLVQANWANVRVTFECH